MAGLPPVDAAATRTFYRLDAQGERVVTGDAQDLFSLSPAAAPPTAAPAPLEGAFAIPTPMPIGLQATKVDVSVPFDSKVLNDSNVNATAAATIVPGQSVAFLIHAYAGTLGQWHLRADDANADLVPTERKVKPSAPHRLGLPSELEFAWTKDATARVQPGSSHDFVFICDRSGSASFTVTFTLNFAGRP